ncbi:unnamed protein product, partial [Gulo gulo]
AGPEDARRRRRGRGASALTGARATAPTGTASPTPQLLDSPGAPVPPPPVSGEGPPGCGWPRCPSQREAPALPTLAGVGPGPPRKPEPERILRPWTCPGRPLVGSGAEPLPKRWPWSLHRGPGPPLGTRPCTSTTAM